MYDNSSIFRILLVGGGGRIGYRHFLNLMVMPNVEVAGIVEANASVLASMTRKVKCSGYASIQEALRDGAGELDGVLICLPTSYHYEAIKISLESGLSVLCEKPLSSKIEEMIEVYGLAKSKNLRLMCGLQRRFDPSFCKLREMVISGEIGRLQLIKTTSRDHPSPSIEFLRNSGGIFSDCCTHDIDFHRWIARENPIEVYVNATAWDQEVKKLNDYDCVIIQMKYASGVTSLIDISRSSSYGYDQRVEIMGTSGMIEGLNKSDGLWRISDKNGIKIDKYTHSFQTRYSDAYSLEVLHFIELIKSKNSKEPLVTEEDVLTCKIIENACQKSAANGIPIKINYDL